VNPFNNRYWKYGWHETEWPGWMHDGPCRFEYRQRNQEHAWLTRKPAAIISPLKDHMYHATVYTWDGETFATEKVGRFECLPEAIRIATNAVDRPAQLVLGL